MGKVPQGRRGFGTAGAEGVEGTDRRGNFGLGWGRAQQPRVGRRRRRREAGEEGRAEGLRGQEGHGGDGGIGGEDAPSSTTAVRRWLNDVAANPQYRVLS